MLRAQRTVRTGYKRSYRADIDGLRAVAIISVVAFHTRLSLFRGGFVGVDVFLVISGYLIGSIVYRDIAEARFSIARFYERRAKRILPALFGVLIFSYITAFVLLSPSELRDFCAEAVAAVSSSANIYHWLKSDYFSSGAEFNPLLMTWSLGIEEQFYLVFPLALLLIHKCAKRSSYRWIVFATALSFICSVVCVRVDPSAAFYLLPTRAWELGIGVVIAIYEVQQECSVAGAEARVANALGLIGLAMIVVSICAYGRRTAFPGIAAALPALGTACLIMSPSSIVNGTLLSSRPMVFIGVVSYSWYLWHWPLLSFAAIVIGGVPSVWVSVSIAIMSLAAAVLSYRFIEQPFRRSVSPTVPLLAGYAALVVLFAGVPMIGYVRRGWPGRVPALLSAETAIREVKRNLCLAGDGVSEPRLGTPCVVDPGGPKLALLGDSHAASLGNALQELAIHNGYGFEQLTKSSCPQLSTVTRRMAVHPGHDVECAAFNRAALDRVLSDSNVRVVVLAAYWSAPSIDGGKEDRYIDIAQLGKKVSEQESYENLHSGLLKTISLLRSSGKRVFVATDVPRFDFDPVSNVRNSQMRSRRSLATLLSSSSVSLDPVVQESLIKPADAATDKIVRRAAKEGGAQVLDLKRNLCPGSLCRFWSGGALFYADSQHLTTAGAEYALRGEGLLSNVN